MRVYVKQKFNFIFDKNNPNVTVFKDKKYIRVKYKLIFLLKVMIMPQYCKMHKIIGYFLFVYNRCIWKMYLTGKLYMRIIIIIPVAYSWRLVTYNGYVSSKYLLWWILWWIKVSTLMVDSIQSIDWIHVWLIDDMAQYAYIVYKYVWTIGSLFINIIRSNSENSMRNEWDVLVGRQIIDVEQSSKL